MGKEPYVMRVFEDGCRKELPPTWGKTKKSQKMGNRPPNKYFGPNFRRVHVALSTSYGWHRNCSSSTFIQMQSWSLENVWSLETVEPHFVVRLTTIANLLSFLYRVGSHHQHCGKMSMALRNQLLGQKACLVESTFLPGKPRDTRAQRLAIRRSVMLWGARASYETISTSADSFTSGSSVLENLENVASKVRLGIELFPAWLHSAIWSRIGEVSKG